MTDHLLCSVYAYRQRMARCMTLADLERYMAPWREDVREHPRRVEIVMAYEARKGELK